MNQNSNFENQARQEKKVLQIFAKEATEGSVKTRLIPTLGENGALRLHKKLLEYALLNLAQQPLYDCELCLAGAEEKVSEFIVSLGQKYHVPINRQHGSDLGERMFSAIDKGLENNTKVVIVGADCASVDSAYVNDAFLALDYQDIVIGPAEDGGYVLIGARVSPDGVFNSVDWGSEKVLKQTLSNLKGTRLTHFLLEERWDVDDASDLERLSAKSSYFEL